jgi:hypothetical protein
VSDPLPDVVISMVSTALAGIPVTDTISPDGAPRYVRFTSDAGVRWAEDVAHTSDLVRYRFRLTYVADASPYGRRGVAAMVDRARAALIDVVPQVAGYVFGPIELEAVDQPIQLDPDAPADVLFGSDAFVVSGAKS